MTKTGFQIRNQADGESIDVILYDVIGDDFYGGSSARDVIKQLTDKPDLKTVNVYLNSPGGNVFDAHAIYNALARHSARVIVNIDGMALSAASVVAMAGDEIRIASNAMMMIHDPWGIAIGGADEMRRTGEMLDKIKGTIVATYAARTKQSEEDISSMMASETWMNADEAVEKGFADFIVEAKKMAALAGGASARAVWNQYRRCPDGLREQVIPKAAALVPADKTQEPTKMAETEKSNEAPKPADIDELHKAFPSATAEFLVACMDAKCTLDQARDKWTAKLESDLKVANEATDTLKAETDKLKADAAKAAEQSKTKASQAVAHGEADGDEPADFLGRAMALVKSDNIDLNEAKRRIAAQDPDCYAEYRESFRTTKPKRLTLAGRE